MGKYLDYIKEEKRNEENLFKIYFRKEGDWYRAFEWSAYLAHYFPNNLEEKDLLKPLKKMLRGLDDGYITVGLQLQSIDKFFPIDKELDIISSEEENLIIIDCELFFKDSDITINNYENILKDWKNNIDFLKSESKNATEKVVNNNDNNEKNLVQTKQDSNKIIRNVLLSIKNYHMSNKTLIDNTLFLHTLQEEIFKLNL